MASHSQQTGTPSKCLCFHFRIQPSKCPEDTGSPSIRDILDSNIANMQSTRTACLNRHGSLNSLCSETWCNLTSRIDSTNSDDTAYTFLHFHCHNLEGTHQHCMASGCNLSTHDLHFDCTMTPRTERRNKPCSLHTLPWNRCHTHFDRKHLNNAMTSSSNKHDSTMSCTEKAETDLANRRDNPHSSL